METDFPATYHATEGYESSYNAPAASRYLNLERKFVGGYGKDGKFTVRSVLAF